MDEKQLTEARRRLVTEHDRLIHSINRHRFAAEDIIVEKTEDEGDLAMISHDRSLLYNLHEGGFSRLRLIQQALKSVDRGDYGECSRCSEDINEKRLDAVPWATMCIGCQEATEAERTSDSDALPVMDAFQSELLQD